MKNCRYCNCPMIKGDIRSGAVSAGAYFIKYETDEKGHKPEKGLRFDNRVVSYACEQCGLVESYLERVKSPLNHP